MACWEAWEARQRGSPIKPRPRRLPNLDIATGEAIFLFRCDLRLSSAGSGSASCSNRRRSVWAQKPQSLRSPSLVLGNNDHLHTVVQQIESCQKPDERLKLPDVATAVVVHQSVSTYSPRAEIFI
ncbi:hypothetical protein BDZ89DRAFT_1076227 [Hymenopellis radicata]|nr:hypothetical protein BDZ89DRAFT_1076227 [Hymenopellis radicata]